jgi:AraC family transcriptional regulator
MNSSPMVVIGPHGNYFGHVERKKSFAGITLAELHYTPETLVPAHRHDFPGFFLAFSGVFETTSGPNRIRFGRGHVSYHGAGDPHSTLIRSRRACGLNVELTTVDADSLKSSGLRLIPPGSKIPILLAQLRAELYTPDAASTLAVQGLALQVTAEFSRETPGHHPKAPAWLRLAKQYIAASLCDKIDMQQLAVIAGVEPGHILTAFKQFVGCTPATYLRKRRIEIARLRLTETKESIAQIAAETGFCDQAYFCHEFRKASGCSPRQYRQQLGQGQSRGAPPMEFDP